MFTFKYLSRIITIMTVIILSVGSVQPVYAAPDNDDFANAISISGSLPIEINTDNTGATLELNEPPGCGYEPYPLKTVWYSYTPSTSATLSVAANGDYIAVYTGESLESLALLGCTVVYYDPFSFQAQEGTKYYLQVSRWDLDAGSVNFWIDFTPPAQAGIDYWPMYPSIYDEVYFTLYIDYDPGGIYDGTCLWTLWDGSNYDQCSFRHQFTVDGDYPLSLNFTTTDGRATEEKRATVRVRTRDIAITKFSMPLVARTNQTKEITVEITNKISPEDVEVYLYKGLPGGDYQLVGHLTMYVPARPKRPTLFKFSYNFTAADAALGKVTFKAEAFIINGEDALPADNIANRSVIVK